MSYTIPEYVDTREQAVLAVASAIKGEAVTGGDGSVNRALDILADVLAEQDVSVPQTNAGAILALAQYVTGGGGGGGGDFTTATVTLQKAEGFGGPLALECACMPPEGLPEATFTHVDSEDASYEFTAVLYKGKCLAYPTIEATAVTTTGDATYDSDLELCIITGDCTLTFADA